MNKFKLSLFAFVAMASVACVTDPALEGDGVATEMTAVAKFVNSSECAEEGKLLLFVDDATADAWIESSATRSGNTQLDQLASELKVNTIKPLFNMNINGEEKRQFNLHRWFTVEFDKEMDLDAVANKFAAISSVNRIQFNSTVSRPEVQVVPVSSNEMVTRAGEEPFNDPKLSLQWHYNNKGSQAIFQGAKAGEDIGAYGAWKYTTGNRNVVVAVVDEGVKYDHEDLKDNMWVNQKELNGVAGVDDDGNGFVDDIHGLNAVQRNGNIAWDHCFVDGDEIKGDSGHGTHVAGTIAAVNNNGIGVAGVAGGNGSGNGVRIMSIQIFDGLGSAGLDGCAVGVEYAADNGASILQNSWGYVDSGVQIGDSQYEQGYSVEFNAINYFVNKSNCDAMTGGVAIFAAGNNAKPAADYPGAYNKYLSVTAIGPDGCPTTYTNHANGCNVAAPGGETAVNSSNQWSYAGNVLSTIPAETIDPFTGRVYGENYGYMQGTSMACPHVSGVAALVLSYALDNGIHITNTQLYDILTTSVRNIDNDLEGYVMRNYYDRNKTPYKFYLDSYKGKMGTGKLDATLAIMNLRGATCVPVNVGEEFALKLGEVIGTGDFNITMMREYVIDEDVKTRLDMTIDYFNNTIYIKCKKPGIGVMTVRYIAGGTAVGGGSTNGGKLMEKEIVIIARDNNDNGAWL